MPMVCTDTAAASEHPSQPPVFSSEFPVAVTFTSSFQTTGSAAVVAALLTATFAAADVVVLPAASRATAVRTWVPLGTVVESHETEYGAALTSEPRLLPSTLNWTPATPTLSDALAETVTPEPATVAPSAGAVRETVGGIWSEALLTVTFTAADVVVFPAASRATAVKAWVPLDAEVVFQEIAYGAALISEPRF